MRIQIINTNYIFDHKLFKVWKFPVLLYGILLIFKTASGLKEIRDYENLFEIISSIIIYSGILLSLLNMFMYSKIGELIIDKNSFVARKYNGKEHVIDLQSLKSIQIGHVKGNFYSVKFKDNVFEVILSKTELHEFRQILTQESIEIKTKKWFDRVQKWVALRKTEPNQK